MQTRGFNGFSYADVAAELGITTASLHYHFPGKAELGEALIERYAERFRAALAAIDAREAAPRRRKLDGLRRPLRRRAARPSACASAACSPPSTRRCPSRCERGRSAFFDANEAWLERVLERGRARRRRSQFDGRAARRGAAHRDGARGRDALARPYGDVARFEADAQRLLASVGA